MFIHLKMDFTLNFQEVEQSGPEKPHLSVPFPVDEANAQFAAAVSADLIQDTALSTVHKDEIPAKTYKPIIMIRIYINNCILWRIRSVISFGDSNFLSIVLTINCYN